jgi:hypothetical protein
MASYEFSDAQNQRLRILRQRLLQVGGLFLAFGAVQLVSSFFLADAAGRWISLAASVLLLGLGWLYIRPLDNLARVINTKGQDIRQIMIGFRDLRVAFLGGEVILVVLVATVIVEIMRLVSPS